MQLAAKAPRALPVDEPKDYSVVRHGVRCAGVHLIIDLYEADSERLRDKDHVENTFLRCIQASGATLLHIHTHVFEQNGGISGVAVLAESHISIHTWPETGYAALDVFMCGSANPDACVPILKSAFDARRIIVEELNRGREM